MRDLLYYINFFIPSICTRMCNSDCPACQRKKGVNILTRSRASRNVARYFVKLQLVFSLNCMQNWRNVMARGELHHVRLWLSVPVGLYIRDTISTLSPHIFPQRGHYCPLSKYALIWTVLISAGSVELIFDGTYEFPFSPKLTVELFSITKRLPRRDPPDFSLGGSREIIY